ncbi:MAG: ASPIC/UnbV domain-containing protein, partial [Bacteroidia bacterium]|nr:ASPIC/UnbV domain-containing protein [Bacteroidia bacterium]
TSGAISTPDLEVSLADFNNDGLLDILITGLKDYLLLNQGDLQFKSNENPFGFKNASSAAVGDLDNDGYLDCYIAFGAPDSPSVFADETWLNFGGTNNHFKLSLSGTQSNKSGIGSQVLLYGPWGMQTRWQNSGVAYGITNSLNIHFGLADHEVIDSLVINWPSGLSDKYVNLDVNDHYIATEGECVEKILDISYSALEIDCDNDTILLTGNNTSGELQWTNGDTLREIQITTPGYFQAESRSACRNVSPIIKLTALESPEVPILNYSQDLILCENDQVVLSTILDTDVLWSTDSVAANITIEHPGPYFASSYNACDTINSDTIWVEFLNQDYEDETIILDSIQDYPLNVPGEEITWFRDSTGTEIIMLGNDILVENIKNDTTVYFQNQATRDIPSFTGGKDIASSEEKYGSDEVRAGMYLTVHQKIRLLSFQTIAEVPGVRKILFGKFGESNVIGETYFAEKGHNFIQTDIILEPGNYAVGTGYNVDELGTVSPRLLVSDSNVNYPYEIDHLLTIDDSFFGEDHYFYYYDLEVEAYSEPCFSDIFAVEFLLDTTTSITYISESDGDVFVFPNPATNILNVALGTYSNGQVDIISLQGSRLMSERYSIDSGEMIELDISSLDSGVYLIRLTGNGKAYYGRFIKL